jgi:hypothetical protein
LAANVTASAAARGDGSPGEERVAHAQQVRDQEKVGEQAGLAQDHGLGAGRAERAVGDHEGQEGAQRALPLQHGERDREVEDDRGIERDIGGDLRVLAQGDVRQRGEPGEQQGEAGRGECQPVFHPSARLWRGRWSGGGRCKAASGHRSSVPERFDLLAA